RGWRRPDGKKAHSLGHTEWAGVSLAGTGLIRAILSRRGGTFNAEAGIAQMLTPAPPRPTLRPQFLCQEFPSHGEPTAGTHRTRCPPGAGVRAAARPARRPGHSPGRRRSTLAARQRTVGRRARRATVGLVRSRTRTLRHGPRPGECRRRSRPAFGPARL